MKYAVKKIGIAKDKASECVVCPVFSNSSQTSVFINLDNSSSKYLSSILKTGDMDGSFGQILILHDVPNLQCSRLILVGCGDKNKLDNKKFTTLHTTLINYLSHTGIKEFANYLIDSNVAKHDLSWKIQQSVVTSEDTVYKFDKYQSKNEHNNKHNKLSKIIFPVESTTQIKQGQKAINKGSAISYGIGIAKDLGNTPPNVCTPEYLAKFSQKLAKEYRKLSTKILDKKQMQQLKMGSLLSVAKGSRKEPKLICIEYKGGKKNAKPIVLVGKGITFDTGGNSLKPSTAMIGMKFDMCGGAAVIGSITTAAELNLPVNIVAIVAAAENMPGGNASRPDDVVKSMSGTTIEILNTDAEGRLVLCDALTYCKRFNPEYVIDVATLTGACVVALGSHNSGLYTNHQPLADKLINAGQKTIDKLWQMPLEEEYTKELSSNIADIANIGGEAGSVTAACFLSKFTENYKWAHLDIAGTATNKIMGRGKTSSSGRPVPALTQFLIDYCS